jgi:hypothetical protein
VEDPYAAFLDAIEGLTNDLDPVPDTRLPHERLASGSNAAFQEFIRIACTPRRSTMATLAQIIGQLNAIEEQAAVLERQLGAARAALRSVGETSRHIQIMTRQITDGGGVKPKALLTVNERAGAINQTVSQALPILSRHFESTKVIADSARTYKIALNH